MIDKSTDATTPNSADAPRVGGEDDSRLCDTDMRVGGEDDSRLCGADMRLGEDDSREVVDDKRRSPDATEKS